MPATRLRLGTRRSALAWVQSSQVARALESSHPGLAVELVGIDTRGDRITDRPLSQVEGKEFFTAEIDAALIEGRVDLTVHSLKDLSLERPAGIALGAVPPRANPRDLALFAPDVEARLAAGEPLRIGTSSPRRAQLLPGFLAQGLPHAPGSEARIELVELRGNVDSRLRRLHEPRGATRHLDGVVLAIAGLSRLYADRETERRGHELLKELLRALRLMLLPLPEVPTAPGQGALAIECRADDAATLGMLRALDDPATRAAVEAERAVLAGWGGGCHQRFGATQVPTPGAGALMYLAGRTPDGRTLAEQRWSAEPPLEPPAAGAHAWDGTRALKPRPAPLLDAVALASALQSPSPAGAVFVAHARALPPGAASALVGRHVWTSGRSSWFALASQGAWVEGCAEGLGIEALRASLAEPLFGLPAAQDWAVLTHDGAAAGWQRERVILTYALSESEASSDDSPHELSNATHVYWSSGSQFDRHRHLVRADAHHASGPGKTAEHLRTAGVAPYRAFPSVEAWRAWVARGR